MDTILYRALATTPLKELEPTALSISIQATHALQSFNNYDEMARLTDAIALATHAHHGQFRANRGPHATTTYIEHPLRNTLRLQRLGVKDVDTLSACLLHDTLEDASEKICDLYDREYDTDVEARFEATTIMSHRFGENTTRIVENVSNPPKSTMKGFTKQQKDAAYVEHMRQIDDPRSLLVKMSDIIDNAGSLQHTPGLKNIPGKAEKYLLAMPVLQQKLVEHERGVVKLTSEAAFEKLTSSMERIEKRLEGFARPVEPVVEMEDQAEPRHDHSPEM